MMKMSANSLEVCVGTLAGVRAALRGGACRVELCSALEVGGITPSAALVEEAVTVGIPVHVLIRPRGGDFLYTADEVRLMAADIRRVVALGARGVVIGALREDGTVDTDACRRMIEAAEGASVTFHRAFDLCRDASAALETVISLRCQRLLTSGQAASAPEGIGTLRAMVSQAAGRLSVMAGAGVNSSNAAGILRRTGCHELHASCKHTVGSLMRYRREGVAMGKPGSDEYARWETDEEEIRRIVSGVRSVE